MLLKFKKKCDSLIQQGSKVDIDLVQFFKSDVAELKTRLAKMNEDQVELQRLFKILKEIQINANYNQWSDEQKSEISEGIQQRIKEQEEVEEEIRQLNI